MNHPVVVFPDVELLVVDYLRTVVDDDVLVRTVKPSPMPATPVVVVRRTGGLPDTPVTERARIDFSIYASTDKDAHDLAQLIRAYVRDMVGVHDGVQVIRTTEFLGLSHFDDPLSDQPRYLTTQEIVVRGESLL